MNDINDGDDDDDGDGDNIVDQAQNSTHTREDADEDASATPDILGAMKSMDQARQVVGFLLKKVKKSINAKRSMSPPSSSPTTRATSPVHAEAEHGIDDKIVDKEVR